MLSIPVPLVFEGKIMDIEKPTPVKQLLAKLSLTPESYLVLVNEKLVTEEEIVSNNDTVRIIKVVSGG